MRILPFLLIPGLTIAAQAETSRVEQRQEPLAMGAKLWVRQGEGQVKIEGWDREELALEAEYLDEARGGKVELRVRQVTGGLEIEVLEPQRPRFFFGRSHLSRCNLVLRVPRKLNLAVRSVDGEISVRDLEGYTRCESVDGGIRLAGLSGEAHVSTVDGAIEARNLQARLKGHSVDGDIRLEKVAGGLDLHTTDGDIDARDLDGWGEGIFLSTVDGRIAVRLGQAKGQLEARTADGRLEAIAPGLQIQEMGTHRLRGKVPGREQTIRLTTGDGDIYVE